MIFVLLAIVGCQEQLDKDKIIELEKSHLGFNIPSSEVRRRANSLSKKYEYFSGIYNKILLNENSRQDFFDNEELKNDLGGHFLKLCVGDQRYDLALDLAKKFIDEGVNPFVPDYFGVTPAVFAASFNRKKILDYMILRERTMDFGEVDDRFIKDIQMYERARRRK